MTPPPSREHGDPGDGKTVDADRSFTDDEQVALVAGVAWTRFRNHMAGYRSLFELAARRDTMARDRPLELQRLGRSLGSAKRRTVETAVAEVARRIEADFAAKAETGGEAPDIAGGLRHPVAVEQAIAAVIVGMGRDMFDRDEATLAVAVGSNGDAARYAMEYALWTRGEAPSTVVGRTLLPAVVASFGELLGGLVRLWLTVDDKAIDKKQIPVGLLRKYPPQDILRRVVDETTDEVIGQGLTKWNKQLAEKPGVRLDSLTEAWPQLVEAFARRNAIVHAGGVADSVYIGRLPEGADEPQLGTPLVCDKRYTEGVLAAVEDFAAALTVAWLARLVPESDQAAAVAEGEVVRALKEKRWRDAKTMAVAALGPLGEDHGHHQLRVNLWMARRELGEDWPKLQQEILGWEPPDDDPDYAVAKAALLRDEQRTLGELRRLQAIGHPIADMADWPLMRDMQQRSKAIASTFRGAATGPQRPPPRPNTRRKRQR